MRDEIKDIIWDFARSVSKTTLNPHLNYSETNEENASRTTAAVNDLLSVMKKYEPKNTAQVARV